MSAANAKACNDYVMGLGPIMRMRWHEGWGNFDSIPTEVKGRYYRFAPWIRDGAHSDEVNTHQGTKAEDIVKEIMQSRYNRFGLCPKPCGPWVRSNIDMLVKGYIEIEEQLERLEDKCDKKKPPTEAELIKEMHDRSLVFGNNVERIMNYKKKVDAMGRETKLRLRDKRITDKNEAEVATYYNDEPFILKDRPHDLSSSTRRSVRGSRSSSRGSKSPSLGGKKNKSMRKK